MFSTNDFCPCKVNKSALKSADSRFGLMRRLKGHRSCFSTVGLNDKVVEAATGIQPQEQLEVCHAMGHKEKLA